MAPQRFFKNNLQNFKLLLTKKRKYSGNKNCCCVKLIPLLVLYFFFVLTYNTNAQNIIYVKWDASGAYNGTSWANAYTSLQTALSHAVSGNEIWVARGTYKPGTELGSTFSMKNGVAIYGGFVETNTSVSERTNFDLGAANETILSGDIGIIGSNDDNCYRIFMHWELRLDNTAILDGFTITGANATTYNGGGIFNQGIVNHIPSPTIKNCTFIMNTAAKGSAIYMYNSSPQILNCVFIANTSTAGGIFCQANSAPIITNCTFSGNIAPGDGAAIYSQSSTPIIKNTIFGEHSTSHVIAGEFDPSKITYSCIQGENNTNFPGSGNIFSDPLFSDANGGR